MTKYLIMQQIEDTDLLEDINPVDLAKEAKLGWLKRLLIVAIWPIIKPYIAKKIGDRLTVILDELFMQF